ncbi:hypothetical protein KKB18_06820 [bacterium]|nr:hypothetical protein [bacterium]
MTRRVVFTLYILLIVVSVFGSPDDTLEPFGTHPEEEYTNSSFYDEISKGYVFKYEGKDQISYSIFPIRWEVRAGYINVETRINDVICWPVSYGGLKWRYDLADDKGYEVISYMDEFFEEKQMTYREGYSYNPVDYRLDAKVEITNIDFTDGVLTLDYKDVYMDYEHTWSVEFSIKGKTLVFHIYATDGNDDALGNYSGVFFDRSVRTMNPRYYILPYIVESNVTFEDKFFYSAYVDRGKSSSSNIQVITETYSNESIYAGAHTNNWINRDRKIVPVDEVCYMTVSSRLLDVFPSFNVPPSWTKKMMDDKIVLDVVYTEGMGFNGNHFQQVKSLLSRFYDYGFRNVFVINHVWQHHGYDFGLPHHYPPGEMYGGLDDFKKITEFTNDKDWLFTTHEDYTVMNHAGRCEHGYFNEKDCTMDRADTNFFGTQTPYFIKHYSFYSISPDKMLNYAVDQSTKLKEECNTTAAFLDLHAGNNPMTVRQIDLNPENKIGNTFKAGVEYTKQLFDAMREIHQGPVTGEGGIGWGRYDTFYAGYLDGVDKWPERSLDAFITPEHELKIIRPLQVNYGLGQYDRFWWDVTQDFKEYDFDIYRAIEIAFGHAGYVQVKTFDKETVNIAFLKLVREYYMMQQLQSRYTPSDIDVEEILYYDDGVWITQDELLLQNKNMEDVLLKLKYSNGLTIWINHKEDKNYIWEPDVYNGITLPIPQNGFVALNTQGELFIECSIMLGNDRIDYVMSGKYLYAENRSHTATDIGYISTDGMAAVQVNPYGLLDVHLLEGTYLSETIFGSKILEASEVSHVNINYRNINEFELTAPFTPVKEGTKDEREKIDVTYYNLPGAWKTEDGKLPSELVNHVSVYVVKDDSEEPAAGVTLSTLTGHELVIENIAAVTKYLVRFSE